MRWKKLKKKWIEKDEKNKKDEFKKNVLSMRVILTIERKKDDQ
jgi:hypothetical protein